MATLTEAQLRDDMDFWSRQLMEHAQFLNLGIDKQPLKDEAKGLQDTWEMFRIAMPGMDTATMRTKYLDLAAQLRAFKVKVYDASRAGWIGWLFPLFIDHVRRELDFSVRRISGGYSDPYKEQCDWLRFMLEHAEFAAHLTDPSERVVIAQATAAAKRWMELSRCCVVPCGPAVFRQMVILSDKAGKDQNAFIDGPLSKAQSIIHPVLGAHVLREGTRFLQSVQSLMASMGPTPAMARYSPPPSSPMAGALVGLFAKMRS